MKSQSLRKKKSTFISIKKSLLKKRTTRKFDQDSDENIEHELVECKLLRSTKLQPFYLFISLKALLMMNIHSHLFKNEVIGFLGGQIFEQNSSQKKVLFIQTAYPGVSLDKNQDKQRNVEINPESASHILKTISDHQQSTLGWYHSHPFFDASPSITDISNHSLYQNQFSQENLPFIASIISPYHKFIDLGLPFVRCFYNKKEVPINLQLNLIPQIDLSNDIIEEIKYALSKWISDTSNQKYLKESWNSGQKKYEKMVKSIRMIFELNKKLLKTFNQDRFLCDFKEQKEVQKQLEWDRGEVEVIDHGVLNKIVKEIIIIVEQKLKVKFEIHSICDCE